MKGRIDARQPSADTKLPPPENRMPGQPGFKDILAFIQQSRFRALRAVNRELVELYWRIGEHLSQHIQTDGWGHGTVEDLAAWITTQEPGIRGYSASNLWRMRQFFETYREDEVLAPLVRELSWSHNTLVFSRCKSMEERAFYIKLAVQERWGRRELERQMNAALFEQAILGKPKLSALLKETHPLAERIFKDRYLVDFVDLPEPHSERDLQKALLQHLKDFLLELGRDFCFIGSEYPVQVGRRDFAIDLLFFHRGLQALVAFELKIGEFEPEHLGKLAFYLEALDRYHRKPHESPSIGVLLCRTRDADVVEFSLSRTLSPALVAEYQTKLPDRHLLQAKLEEFYQMVEREGDS